MESFSINTQTRTQFIDITNQVTNIAKNLGIKDGVLTIFIPHTTAGITINENADPDVLTDMDVALEHIVPWRAGYRHCEGNSAAHVKASMMGSSVQVLVKDEQLQLGTWQSIYFCEFDGARTRTVLVGTNNA